NRMADDNKIEFELALRDSMSPVLRTVQQSLDNIVKTLDKTAGTGTSAVAKFTQQTQRLNEHVKQTNLHLADMGGMLGGISSSLLGPASLVFAVSQVAKQLENFATAQAQSRNFARDTGFSLRTLADVQVQFMRNGQERVEADRTLGKFAQKFDEIISKQTSSTFYQQYRRYNAAAADEFFRLGNEGKRWEAVQVIRDDYLANPEGSRYRTQLETLLEVETSLWPILNDNLDHAQKFW